ncbi:MAG: aquaporin family protein [Planctomycetes bacterium]|nr:aquaporin family protein [Planctomycetota bacterium]
MSSSLPRRVVAEFLGTTLLLLAIVGSGIMAERLCDANIGLALLANALATAGALFALMSAFAPLSGAHFNPAVSLYAALRRELPPTSALSYAAAQITGAMAGVLLAHALFDLPLVQSSQHVREGFHLALSEGVATFALLLVIALCSARAPQSVALAVALWILGAYWFTSSTSFANPAVTVARACTDTFCGIRPADMPAFLVAQLAATLLATRVLPWLMGPRSTTVAS